MADDGNMFKTFKNHNSPLKALAWSPDCKLLCSVGNKGKVNNIAIFDTLRKTILFR